MLIFMNFTSEHRLEKVSPQLAAKVRQLADLCTGKGFSIVVVQGLRTVQEQDALFAKGRDKNGNIINKRQVVTYARGGQSWHNFGLAVDCAPLDAQDNIDWNAVHPSWRTMEELGVSVGLTSGANWVRMVDAPHFQLTGRFPENAPNDEVRQLYASGGLQAVWAQVALTP